MTATRVLEVPRMLGRLLGSDGYLPLIDWLKREFEVREPTDDLAGNLIPFPYDWRLSCRYNAQRLAAEVLPQLDRWSKETGKPPRLTLICHSMGGLVARWFLEKLGGAVHTRRLITLGTPYRGAIMALDRLGNGLDPGFGPIRAVDGNRSVAPLTPPAAPDLEVRGDALRIQTH